MSHAAGTRETSSCFRFRFRRGQFAVTEARVAAIPDHLHGLAFPGQEREPDVSPAVLRGLRVPTQVVTGDRTRGYYRLIADVTATAIHGARIAKLPGCGHMTIVESPTETAAILDRFLAG